MPVALAPQRRVIQVIYTFVVKAESLAEAHKLLPANIELTLQPGVNLVGRQVKASDPFRLSDEE